MPSESLLQSLARRPEKIERLIPYISHQIEKRRRKWRLVSVPFEDTKQIVLIHVVRKYHTFDPKKGEFSHWLSRVITNAIKNVLRDNYLKYSRPCILGCIYNTGEDNCSRTKSGKQCAQCPLYRDWERVRKEQFNINQPVNIDNHIQEVDGEFFDVESAADRVNGEMKKRLKPADWRIYRTIYIDRQTDDIRKDTIKSYEISYPNFARLKRLFVETARDIIKDENLA